MSIWRPQIAGIQFGSDTSNVAPLITQPFTSTSSATRSAQKQIERKERNADYNY
jgi:hypothetical protein